MVKLTKKHRYFLSILSGVVLFLSFPYSGSLTPLVFIGLVPLLIVESVITDQKYRSGKVLIHAYISFLIFNIGSTWWIYNASGGGAALAIGLNSLFQSIVFYFFHLTKKHVGKKEGYISLFIYWIAFEYFHHNWELSWTWLSLGNFFSIRTSWVQWYSYTGIFGGSFWILLINVMVFIIVRNVYIKKESWKIQTPLVWMTGVFLLVPIAISLITFFRFTEKTHPLEVVVVQPNIDPYNEKFVGNVHDQLAKMVQLAEKEVTKKTGLIVAPETAISANFREADFERFDFYHYLVSEKARLHNIPWHIGASTFSTFDQKRSRASFPLKNQSGYIEFYNSSVLLDEKNEAQFVHKSKLVPGAEIIPFSNYFPFLEQLSIQNGGTSGTLGVEEEPAIFDRNELKIAPVICYESVYGEWVTEQCRKGAQLISVVTNDGWWGDTPGYKQHMSFSRLRAIENRRWVVRSANTGISCFINQRGDVVQASNWWEEATLKQQVNLNSEATFYIKYGDVMGRSFSFVSILLLLYTFVRRFKTKYMK